MKLEQAVSGAEPHAAPLTAALTLVIVAPGRIPVSCSCVDHVEAPVVEAAETAADAAAN